MIYFNIIPKSFLLTFISLISYAIATTSQLRLVDSSSWK